MRNSIALVLFATLGACDPTEQTPVETPTVADLPGHNECLPPGEVMDDDTCLAVVEHDGRSPTTGANQTGMAPDPEDPRLTDPDYLWLEAEIERCTCVCCHKGSLGGPGVHRWDFEYEPVWIDSANDWTLAVFMGDTEEYEQTLPTEDQERLREVITRERERRRE